MARILLPLVLISLLAAVWSGWIRIGYMLPGAQTASQHGALMVGSFLATVIILERAITFHNKWWLLVPGINGLSGIAFVAGYTQVATWCIIAGAVGFSIICLHFLYRFKHIYHYVFVGGAFCYLIGAVVLLRTGSYPFAVHWWMVFLLFTIVAERLELSRFLPVSASRKALLLIACGIVLVALVLPFHTVGQYILAAGMAAIAGWLMRYDMARRSVRAGGAHKYSAVLLLAGYAWLAVAAILMVVPGNAFQYDAVLHSFFVGFVLSMIFSHAPIILPGVLQKPMQLYRPFLYAFAIALHVSLAMRVVGDVLLWVPLRRWGGMLNGWVLLLFLVSMGLIVREEFKSQKSKFKSQK